MTTADGKELVYDEDEDEYSVSFNLEDLDHSNLGINKLRIFSENSMDAFEKEREKEFEDVDAPNALVIGGGSQLSSVASSEPNGPMDDQVKETENTWQEVDDGVGNVYYYNLVSGESTWDRPEELDVYGQEVRSGEESLSLSRR